jgi:DNA invertase Pin-like site-specific DNA recombinase
LFDLPADGGLWVYGVGEDGTPAFTDYGIECPRQIIADERAGWQLVREFADRSISGAKGRHKRPRFDDLCKSVSCKECDLVAAWSVDRIGCSLQDLVGFLGEIRSKPVDLYLHRQGPARRHMTWLGQGKKSSETL